MTCDAHIVIRCDAEGCTESFESLTKHIGRARAFARNIRGFFVDRENDYCNECWLMNGPRDRIRFLTTEPVTDGK